MVAAAEAMGGESGQVGMELSTSEFSYDQYERTDLQSLQPTAELCAYYRTRIASFENERDEMLDLLKNSSTQREELHRTQWELNKRVEEVKDLQKVFFFCEQFYRRTFSLDTKFAGHIHA
jgi:hypothetical protein